LASTSSIKVGDLISVRYATKNPYDGSMEGYGQPFFGIVVETPFKHRNDKLTVYKMYCFSAQDTHILMPEMDIIEVISESR
jgi:hypothetical protein